jgi:hypothetical protein
VSQFNQVSRSQQATKDLNQVIRGFFITVTKNNHWRSFTWKGKESVLTRREQDEQITGNRLSQALSDHR